MVKIAIAGGSGQVARELIDALRATNKHELTILTREASPNEANLTPEKGLYWRTVDYTSVPTLTTALTGTHTLLSFIQPLSDPHQLAQKNLITACIAAGVKRFAPSEYGSAGTDDMPWWDGKQKIRDYLVEMNRNGKVLEYTLIQPGLFLNYLAYPYLTTTHITPLQTVFDFANRRAIVVSGYEEAIMTFTSAADLAAMICRAVDYEGEWPEVSGICGNKVKVRELLEIGARVRGQTFSIETIQLSDLEAGKLNTTWKLAARHRSISENEAEEMQKQVMIGMLISTCKGAWAVSDELNGLFPDHEFMGVEEFLEGVWAGKP